MPKPLLQLLAAAGVAVCGHYILCDQYPDAKNSETLNYALSLLGNVVAAFMYVWVLSLLKQVEPSSSELLPNATPVEPARWSQRRAVAVLAAITFVAAILSQVFIDAVWFHAQEMVDANLLTTAGKQRLGIYFLGLVPLMVWAPLVTYASLSIGRRSVNPAKYSDHFFGAAIGLGAVVVWNALADYRTGAPAPAWQVLPRIPGDTDQMKAYGNAIGYAIQIGAFAVTVLLYSGWTRLWSCIGGFLHRRGLA